MEIARSAPGKRAALNSFQGEAGSVGVEVHQAA